ncbi:MAG: hypothetical protein FWG08_02460 [Propionibacteriaceae bacterium]|nr:hypothetical protein [Propionibacteriaceae bacterium]
MKNWSNIMLATKALVDPATTSADLMDIAKAHQSLWTDIVAHPKADPTLLRWLADEAYHPFISALATARLPLESQLANQQQPAPLPFLGIGLEKPAPTPPVETPASVLVDQPVVPTAPPRPAETPTQSPASSRLDVDAPFIAPQPRTKPLVPSWLLVILIGVVLALIALVLGLLLSDGQVTVAPTTEPTPTETIDVPQASDVTLSTDQFVHLVTGGKGYDGDRGWWQMSVQEQNFIGEYADIRPRVISQAADFRGDGVPPADWPSTVNYGTVSKAVTAGVRTYNSDPATAEYGQVVLRLFTNSENAFGFCEGWAEARFAGSDLHWDFEYFDGVIVWWLTDETSGALSNIAAQYGNVAVSFDSYSPTRDELTDTIDMFRFAVDEAADSEEE